jgi:hypothetical protein
MRTVIRADHHASLVKREAGIGTMIRVTVSVRLCLAVVGRERGMVIVFSQSYS